MVPHTGRGVFSPATSTATSWPRRGAGAGAATGCGGVFHPRGVWNRRPQTPGVSRSAIRMHGDVTGAAPGSIYRCRFRVRPIDRQRHCHVVNLRIAVPIAFVSPPNHLFLYAQRRRIVQTYGTRKSADFCSVPARRRQ